jgi:hypothetical protein
MRFETGRVVVPNLCYTPEFESVCWFVDLSVLLGRVARVASRYLAVPKVGSAAERGNI